MNVCFNTQSYGVEVAFDPQTQAPNYHVDPVPVRHGAHVVTQTVGVSRLRSLGKQHLRKHVFAMAKYFYCQIVVCDRPCY